MSTGPEKLFYTLSAIALGSALFVVTPVHNPEISDFQSQVRMQFAIAARQEFGDHPVADIYDNFQLVATSVVQFYQLSADSLIAVSQPAVQKIASTQIMQKLASHYNTTPTSVDVAYLVSTVRPQILGASITAPQFLSDESAFPRDFMKESPLENIVPTQTLQPVSSSVSFTFTSSEGAGSQVWQNVTDGTTGQTYCVSVFNAYVNQYLGPCKNDYH
jgi:hypothetical protein